MWTTFDSFLTRGKSEIIAATITNHGEMQLKHYTCLYQTVDNSWRRHQMEPFSALLAICAGNSPVTGEFSAQRPVTRSFDAFFDLRLNKRLSKQSWGWGFETLSRPLWRHCNVPFHRKTKTIRSRNNTHVFTHAKQAFNLISCVRFQRIICVIWRHQRGKKGNRITRHERWWRGACFGTKLNNSTQGMKWKIKAFSKELFTCTRMALLSQFAVQSRMPRLYQHNNRS